MKYYNEYNKLLKTRNEYLKILFNNSIADATYLDIITDKLIEKAVLIYQKRKEYIDYINLHINDYYKEIANDCGLVIKYVPNISIEEYDSESIRKKLKHTLKKNYLKELNNKKEIIYPYIDVEYSNDVFNKIMDKYKIEPSNHLVDILYEAIIFHGEKKED